MITYNHVNEIRYREPSTLGIRGWGGTIDSRTIGKPGWTKEAPVWKQLRSSEMHEPEFQIFKVFSDAECFVDIGANCGQSIASFRAANKSTKTVSFEPSPYAFAIAEAYADELPNSQVFNHAIGPTGKLDLYTPVIDGLLVTPLASSDASIFDVGGSMRAFCEKLAEGRDIAVLHSECEMRPLEDFGRFGLLKIDVEGAERRVIDFMSEQIAHYRPLMFVEKGDSRGGFDILSKLGYLGYKFSMTAGGWPHLEYLDLGMINEHAVPVNIIFVHQSRYSEYARRGVSFDRNKVLNPAAKALIASRDAEYKYWDQRLSA